ncbi:hypothetical protein SLS54_002023 [Diplodia seriata]
MPKPEAYQETLDINGKRNRFSDMEVHLRDGSIVKCHRVIMCGRCGFFENAMQGSWKENSTRVVEMFNDPPDAVNALIDFLYTAGYEFDKEKDVPDLILFHLDVLVVAATYLVNDLVELAGHHIVELFRSKPELAFKVLPEVGKVLTEHPFDYNLGWSGGDYTILYLVIDQRHLLIEQETWDAMMKESLEFMQRLKGVCRDEWERWFNFPDEAAEFLARFQDLEPIRLELGVGPLTRRKLRPLVVLDMLDSS